MGDFSLTLGAVLTIISIITAIGLTLIFQWWRNRKVLSYAIISNTQLLTAKEEIRDKLEIKYEGNPVKNVRLFVLRIINSGRQPINDTDFKKPLDFVFSNDTQILSIDITEKNPEDLEVALSAENSKFSISPLMLNAGDSVQVKAVLNSNETSIRCEGRILGVKKIGQIKVSDVTGDTYFNFVSMVVGVVLMIGIGSAAIIRLIRGLYDSRDVVAVILCLIIGLACFFAMISYGRSIYNKHYR